MFCLGRYCFALSRGPAASTTSATPIHIGPVDPDAQIRPSEIQGAQILADIRRMLFSARLSLISEAAARPTALGACAAPPR